MSSSALNLGILQAKIGNVQNQADSTSVYSNGVWSFKNSTALTSVTITDSGNVGIGTASPAQKLAVVGTTRIARPADATQYLELYSSGGEGFIDAVNSAAGTNQPIVFRSGNNSSTNERMRIDASGNLLVGTAVANPIVSGVNGVKVFAPQGIVQANASSNPAFEVGRYVTTGNMMIFYYGAVNVGNISTNGSTITFSGNALSDERWKENLNPINDALSSVKQIQFVEFDYKENKQKSAGVTAQQLQTIPELSKFVIDGSDGESYKAVDYNALIGYLGKAIQELSAKNEALEARLAALESKP